MCVCVRLQICRAKAPRRVPRLKENGLPHIQRVHEVSVSLFLRTPQPLVM